MASAPSVVAYDAVPTSLPPNMASLGFQATQTAEFGDYVHLGGTGRVLRTVTVTMSDWALYSDYTSDARYSGNSGSWTHPLTLNVYSSHLGANGAPDSLLAATTQTATIPWRPVADPTCTTATAWRAPNGNCYNGLAFNVTFDLTSSNVTLPDDVIVAVAYNTQSYGSHPVGVTGPYNSLNVGLQGSVSAGTDDNADRVFWNTSTAASYTDHGAGGVRILREDNNWTPYGTVPIQIAVADTSTVYVNSAWSSFANGSDPDGSGPATAIGTDAFTTIQGGVNGVAAGGTVDVAAGTYVESLAVGKSVTLEGHAHAASITGSMTITAPDVTVDGFTLTNPTGTSAILVSGASNAHITGNDIHDVGGSGSTVTATGSVQAIYVNRSSSADIGGIVISGNTISHIRSNGTGSGKSIKAIFIGDSTGLKNVTATISGNTLSDIVSSGWGAYGILVNHATSSTGSSSVDIENNTISNLAGTFAHAIGLEGDTPNARVIGNTISALTDSDSPANPDATAITFEANPHAVQATVTGNSWATGVPFGVVVVSTATGPVTAANNWWGSAAAAGIAGRTFGSVTTAPWCTDAACATLSNNADLTALSLSGGTLSPAFSASATAYSVSVGNAVTSVTASETAAAGASVVVSGGSSLVVGSNTVTVAVTSADGSVTKTYAITVNRAANGNAVLTSLSLSSGTLSPAFSGSTTSYSASVGNDVTSVTVSETAFAGATVVVSGGSSLVVGGNTVTVAVTAADGATTRTYSIVVTRAAAAAAAVAPPPVVTTTVTVPVVNAPVSAPAVPGTSGVVTVAVAAPVSAPGVVAAAPVTVGVAWPPEAFAEPVTVLVTPSVAASIATVPPGGTAPVAGTPVPVAGGFSLGATVVQVSVTNATGTAVRAFEAPLVIHVSAGSAGDVPAYSQDGTSWTTIPALSSPELPVGQQDGYFVNPDGSIDIYTRHATYFAVLRDTQAPSAPRPQVRVAGASLRLSWGGARDNIRVSGYVVSLNGHGYKTSKRTVVVLPARAGRYSVVALDAAGNKSKASPTITVVRQKNGHLHVAH